MRELLIWISGFLASIATYGVYHAEQYGYMVIALIPAIAALLVSEMSK